MQDMCLKCVDVSCLLILASKGLSDRGLHCHIGGSLRLLPFNLTSWGFVSL